MRRILQAHLAIEQLGRVDERVAVEPTKPREFGLLQSRNGAEQVHLGAIFELGLEAHHIPQGAERIVLAQLDNRIGPATGARIIKADRLHRTIAQCVDTAFRHNLDRHAAFEIGRVLFPVAKLGFLAIDQALMESEILLLVHRAVDIVIAVALIPARRHPADIHIDTVFVDDRCDRIEKGKRIGVRGRANAFGEGNGGKRARRDDSQPAIRKAVDAFADNFDIGMLHQRFGHSIGESIAIHSEGRAGRYFMRVSAPHDDRAEIAHFLMQQADSIALGIIRAEAVGAYQLSQPIRLVGRCHIAAAAHFGQADLHALFGELPCGLGPSQAAADYLYVMVAHGLTSPGCNGFCRVMVTYWKGTRCRAMQA